MTKYLLRQPIFLNTCLSTSEFLDSKRICDIFHVKSKYISYSKHRNLEVKILIKQDNIKSFSHIFPT